MFLVFASAHFVRSVSGSPDGLSPNGSHGYNGRDLWDLLSNCFLTILISIWVSLHPNVPDFEFVGEGALGSFLNELIAMGIAVIAPELIILWGMRQRCSAHKTQLKYKEFGWSNAHGFLALMKGIALLDRDGHFVAYLQDKPKFDRHDFSLAKSIQGWTAHEDLKTISRNGATLVSNLSIPETVYLDDTRTTRSDKAKSDHGMIERLPDVERPPRVIKGQEDTRPIPPTLEDTSCLLHFLLSKGLVKIPESEIKGNLNHSEVVATLIFLFQIAWFIVQIIARGSRNLYISELEALTFGFAILNFFAYIIWWEKPQRVRYPYRVVCQLQLSQFHLELVPREKTFWKTFRYECSNLRKRVASDYSFIRGQWESLPGLLFLPIYPFCFFLSQLMSMLNGDGAATLVPDYLFSSGIDGFRTSLWTYGAVYGISILFGLMHFISSTTGLVWRVGAALVTVVPLGLLVTQVVIFRNFQWFSKDSGTKSIAIRVFQNTVALVHFLLIACYIVTRIMLIVTALVAISRLPDDAFLQLPFVCKVSRCTPYAFE